MVGLRINLSLPAAFYDRLIPNYPHIQAVKQFNCMCVLKILLWYVWEVEILAPVLDYCTTQHACKHAFINGLHMSQSHTEYRMSHANGNG